MDYHRFATLAIILTSIPSRRHLLAGLTGFGLALGISPLPDDATAKQRGNRKRKRKKKGKGKRPPACVPSCVPGACGSNDGCGGTCGCTAGSVCHEGTCHACTVTCDGNGVTCGNTLKTALASGGTVYACPGRYVGNFEIAASQVLAGAGDGDNPATSTILDANQSGRVLLVNPGNTATLRGLRVTGGNLPDDPFGGAGIRNQGKLTLTQCTVSKNTGKFSAGISHGGGNSLILTNCTISENTSADTGGGINANGGMVTINGGTISGNRAFNGGGIANIGSTVTVNAGVIKGNRARNAGAGVFNQGTITFDSASRITGNIAEGGGGIYNSFGSTVNLNGVTLATNVPDNCAPAGDVPGCSG